ncbi:hypothetical protein COW36_22725 [bacterium (Candidatus Blackallbacteria) CG17_big_fil_post_rev_8_21_14_2_50_48_46]|uniref:Phytanoyl-CoA dioxygenase n=1 Tax=bacterium (Candidatus Blackallbacteria) CG17_big_fil_post_rev_8_21_14_2_50_48_46 TaxID=2014261 RepID=A0A2M7FY26_9BACT|nr:MAG: hypothetical protein COW64_07495 [bacterium (Candidatus Blackallbacteria) CG18_big_fil_WC_8_21_14_2_50_49_26]PIW14194.1 MAG: hypothetical protein COW36_22725 [bacterium (Candidatus Blackallbacteria) CG17_big_fil_post_rev_8_21_14_2_50_48_46]PIW46735.1 MAG: hypothetical protein COW20_15000 [bacterium (Candidatus Blackallbacteria) CG13_big_fil_rev_8_21_14_2_50_49_14]
MKESLPIFSCADAVDFCVQALRTQGCFLWQNVFATKALRLLKEQLEVKFDKAEVAYLSGKMHPSVYQERYQYGHLPAELEGDFVSESLKLLAVPALQPLLKSLFGAEVAILIKNSLPRRQSHQWPQRVIPFHQDAEFLGGCPAINFWIPLNACGQNAPGLELLREPQQKLWFQIGSDRQTPFVEQRDERIVLAQNRKDAFWKPEMEPGDLLVFDSYLLHRTSLLPSMWETRYSLEIRLAPMAFAQYLPHLKLQL